MLGDRRVSKVHDVSERKKHQVDKCHHMDHSTTCENYKFYHLSGMSLSFCLSWKVAEQQLEGGGRKWKRKKKKVNTFGSNLGWGGGRKTWHWKLKFLFKEK